MSAAVSTECGESVTFDHSGGSTTPIECIRRYENSGSPALPEEQSFDAVSRRVRNMLLTNLDRLQPRYCGGAEEASLLAMQRSELLREWLANDPARQGFFAKAAAPDRIFAEWATATFRSASVLWSSNEFDALPRLAEWGSQAAAGSRPFEPLETPIAEMSSSVWERDTVVAQVDRENEFRATMWRIAAQASAEGAEAATSVAQDLALRVWRSLFEFSLVATDVDYECRGGIVLEVTLAHPALRAKDGRRATITAENDGRVSVLTADGSSPSINVLSTTTRRPAGVTSYTIKDLVEHARRFLKG